jgi:hypothetical protein
MDNEFGESADRAAEDVLCRAFVPDPELIDGILVESIRSNGAKVQAVLIGVYDQLMRSSMFETEDDRFEHESQHNRAIRVALQRVLQLLSDETLDLDPLFEVVQTIETGSRNHPDLLLAHQDILLGTLAKWSLVSDARPAPPTIILLGEPPAPPALIEMQKQSRDMRWQAAKRDLGKAIAKLVEAHSQQFSDTILQAFANLNSKTQYAFKGEITRLLGVLGSQYDLLPRVLPSLWSALMDNTSAVLRSRAAEAIGQCFREAGQSPPSDIVDMLVLYINDDYVAVHKAAAKVIGDNARWLTEDQAIQALQRLSTLANYYKKVKPIDLELIAEAILDVSRLLPKARGWAVNKVLALMPSGFDIVDLKILEELMRNVRPTEPAAHSIVPAVLRWIIVDDENDIHDRKNEAFSWLHNLPQALFEEVRTCVMEEAKKGVKDPRRAVAFASLFCAHDDYDGERDILALARSHIPNGLRFQQVAATMDKLTSAAARNSWASKAT